MGDNEGHWLALARAGDQEAFRHLVSNHSRPLFRLCGRITRDPALAEDAVQEAFYRAWCALPQFEHRSSFSTWLHRIAINAALQVMRSNARHRSELTAVDEAGATDLLAGVQEERPGPEAHAAGAQVIEEIGKHLDLLSGIERAAFVMRHYEGESLEVIGATLALNTGQCKQAIFRAVGKLRRGLEHWRRQ